MRNSKVSGDVDVYVGSNTDDDRQAARNGTCRSVSQRLKPSRRPHGLRTRWAGVGHKVGPMFSNVLHHLHPLMTILRARLLLDVHLLRLAAPRNPAMS